MMKFNYFAHYVTIFISIYTYTYINNYKRDKEDRLHH